MRRATVWAAHQVQVAHQAAHQVQVAHQVQAGHQIRVAQQVARQVATATPAGAAGLVARQAGRRDRLRRGGIRLQCFAFLGRSARR